MSHLNAIPIGCLPVHRTTESLVFFSRKAHRLAAPEPVIDMSVVNQSQRERRACLLIPLENRRARAQYGMP